MRRATTLALVPAVAGALVGGLLAAGPGAAEPAPVYCGANDVVYPKISSITFTPGKVVIGRANRTVTVTVKASDDCAIDHIWATLAPKGVATRQVIYITSWKRIAGTASNGTWQATRTLADQERGGAWEIFRIGVTDTYFNETLRWRLGRVHVRHETALKLRNPKNKVTKKVQLIGRLRAYGDFGTWKVKIQTRKAGKKTWKTVSTVRTNAWGDFSKKVEIKGTMYVRAVHDQSDTTIAAKSKSYKVKRK